IHASYRKETLAAVSWYDRHLKEKPFQPMVLYNSATQDLRSGNVPRAIHKFCNATYYYGSTKAYNRIALYHLSRNGSEEAWEALCARCPKAHFLLLGRGDAHLLCGQYEKALTWYRREEVPAAMRCYSTASAYFGMGKFRETLDELRKIPPSANFQISIALNIATFRAVSLFALGRYREAANAFSDRHKLQPTLSALHSMQIASKIAENGLSAISSPEESVNLASLLFSAHQYEKSAEIMKTVLTKLDKRLDKKSKKECMVLLGVALWKLGRADEALQFFRTIEREIEVDVIAGSLLCLLYQEAGEHGQALVTAAELDRKIFPTVYSMLSPSLDTHETNAISARKRPANGWTS
ncbi:MAG: tetratricopeptide repeat protein, partial [Planctomycetota bacterium]